MSADPVRSRGRRNREPARRATIGEQVDIVDVGFACAYLATPSAWRLPGETLYVDGSVNIRV